MRSWGFFLAILFIGTGCLAPQLEGGPSPKVTPSPTAPAGTAAPTLGPQPTPPVSPPQQTPPEISPAPPSLPPLVPGSPPPGPLLVERLRAFSNFTYLLQGGHFRAEYRVRNMGDVTLENITAQISFTSNNLRPVTLAYSPEEAPRTQVIPRLGPREERHIFWLVYAWNPGDGDVLLEVRSAAGFQMLNFSVRVR